MDKVQKNTTVIKTMEILNNFKEIDQMSLSEMMNLTGIPRTTLIRMITSLEEMGFLQKNADGKYMLGLSFLRFGQLVAERIDIRRIAYPVMKNLQVEADEAVNLVIVDGNEALYIDKIDTSQPVKVYTAIGRRAPLYGGACPRILLAYMPEAEREKYLQTTELVAYATGTIIDKEDLRRELDLVRKQGYSISHSELRDYTSAVGAPVFNGAGEVVASVSLAGLTERFKGERLAALIALLKTATYEISAQLGYNNNSVK